MKFLRVTHLIQGLAAGGGQDKGEITKPATLLTAFFSGGSVSVFTMRTLSVLSRSTLFVVGIALVALGLGNTLVAHFKVREYQTALARTSPPVASEQTFGKNTRLHHFSSEAWSRRSLNRAKLEFYHVLHNIGWLILCSGGLCTIMAVRRQRYRQPRWESSSVERG